MFIELVFPDKSVLLARLPCPAANTPFLDESNSALRPCYFDLRELRQLSRIGSGELSRTRPEMLLDEKTCYCCFARFRLSTLPLYHRLRHSVLSRVSCIAATKTKTVTKLIPKLFPVLLICRCTDQSLMFFCNDTRRVGNKAKFSTNFS
jgi:hypothetical protein